MTVDSIQAEQLFSELSRAIKGEVKNDTLSRHLYSTDASDFQKPPIMVVIPRDTEDISATIKIASRRKIPIIPRGGGSSLSGQTVGTGIVIDHSKYLNRVLNLNTEEKWVEVEAGVVLDVLNDQLSRHGLMVGPDPSSSAVATIGGMVGNNSTGSHSFKYRMMSDHILEIEAVLSDGELVVFDSKKLEELGNLSKLEGILGQIYQRIPEILEMYRDDIKTGYPKTWRNVAGYGLNRSLAEMEDNGRLNIAGLIAGSEGTLAGITRIKLGLVPKPKETRLMILHYDDLSSALSDVPGILEHVPSAVELMSYPVLKMARDHAVYRPILERFVDGLPGAVLVVEFNADSSAELDDQVDKLKQTLVQNGFKNTINLCQTTEEIGRVWHIRKSVLGLLVSAPGDTKPIWVIDDASVPVEALVDYTNDVIKMGRKYGIEINFDAHAAAGCLHMGLDLNLRTREGLKNLEILSREIMSIAIAHNGTTTGEHGEGLARSYFTEQLYGPGLYQAFREVKAVFDPNNLFNPRKIVDSIEPWDTNWLQYHPDYKTPYALKDTFFDYAYHGGYDKLVEMCNGQGTCRSHVAGNMCPSFRMTGDERDSTRGRANALRMAMTGELGDKGLNNPEVKEILSLCLQCKACRNDCSSRVDMAKLKVEFLAYYQAQNGVPLRSRLFGKMPLSSAMGSLAPGLANAVFQNKLFKQGLDNLFKIDKRRQLPSLAPKNFRQWYKNHRPPADQPRGKVVLWDDCHLTYHEPEIGIAATRVLEAMGFEILLLKNKKCCGRPAISKGLLGEAKKLAERNVKALFPYAEQGIPIVGLEPSCIACMRDEYPDLLQTEEAKAVAGQSFFFEEFFIENHQRGDLDIVFQPTESSSRIKLHSHCYQKAFDTAGKLVEMLKVIPNAKIEEIDCGCCGMAGSFGYEKEHYDISMAIGEQQLFPEIRSAGDNTIIAAAGTSCRQQIKDGADRKASHPVEVLASFLK